MKREDVHARFSDSMSLLHCTVVSRDAASVEHVLNLGADVNCKTAGGYTPLIIAVLQRSVEEHTKFSARIEFVPFDQVSYGCLIHMAEYIFLMILVIHFFLH